MKPKNITAYAVVIGKEVEGVYLNKRWAQSWAMASNKLDRKIDPKHPAKVVRCKIIINI